MHIWFLHAPASIARVYAARHRCDSEWQVRARARAGASAGLSRHLWEA